MDRLIQMGKDLNYEEEKLQDFVKQQQDYKRDGGLRKGNLKGIGSHRKKRKGPIRSRRKIRKGNLKGIESRRRKRKGRISSWRKKR